MATNVPQQDNIRIKFTAKRILEKTRIRRRLLGAPVFIDGNANILFVDENAIEFVFKAIENVFQENIRLDHLNLKEKKKNLSKKNQNAPDKEIAPHKEIAFHEEIALHEEDAHHEERAPHEENPPVEEITVEKEIRRNKPDNLDDPALWPPMNLTIREYFVLNPPKQNVEIKSDSGRQIGEKIQREWLIYSPSSKSVFCYVGNLFGNSDKGLCTTGFRDRKNVTSRLASHETSLLHRTSVCQLSQLFKTAGRIDSQMVQQNQNERAYWKDVIVSVFEVLKFIAQRGLGIFGDNETFGSEQNGNFSKKGSASLILS
ncbi:zinc finger MYM-type protein 5-like [Hydra vulgaris]|uniref:Zinc finger MYM-type protein 5-like n=1 Tax=Hydra vulgaris TaxID=6087 RepID=A0ABM4CL78_HYDVU